MNTEFDIKFTSFLTGLEALYADYMTTNFPTLTKEVIVVNKGKRYLKVIKKRTAECDSGSAFCFVDTTNGDVLKTASWNSPAKGARGNIHDVNNGLGRMTAYGPEYNK